MLRNGVLWLARLVLGKFSIPAQQTYADPFVLAFDGKGVFVHTEDNDGATHIILFPLIPR